MSFRNELEKIYGRELTDTEYKMELEIKKSLKSSDWHYVNNQYQKHLQETTDWVVVKPANK